MEMMVFFKKIKVVLVRIREKYVSPKQIVDVFLLVLFDGLYHATHHHLITTTIWGKSNSKTCNQIWMIFFGWLKLKPQKTKGVCVFWIAWGCPMFTLFC